MKDTMIKHEFNGSNRCICMFSFLHVGLLSVLLPLNASYIQVIVLFYVSWLDGF